MNVLGKIIAVVLFAFMILLIINYKSLLPYFSSAALGGTGVESPFQIGSSYVDQANAMSPYGNAYGSASQTTYAEFKAAQAGAVVRGGEGKPAVRGGKVTVEKRDNFLYMTTEYLQVPKQNPRAHIWIANSPTITDSTRYLDFGVIKPADAIQTYTLNVGPSRISLTEFKHIMVIDTETFTIYGQSTLGK